MMHLVEKSNIILDVFEQSQAENRVKLPEIHLLQIGDIPGNELEPFLWKAPLARNLVCAFYFPGIKLNANDVSASFRENKPKIANAASHIKDTLSLQVARILSKQSIDQI
jgi:hypothetical protein